ncbi:hypothetical protein [Aneurinibacillus tyrosinisolvens]|uniref:hypothetical protein n=1 Tax=Aneurinibacillus tyrosinisolvens TaxID=1443435 RepID=UPI00063FAD44|nr:hypothetical protein [Aneurinibacillus tyrosinisolvens]
MTEEQVRRTMDKVRHAIYLGERLPEGIAPNTQEEYLQFYEERTERNPLEEKALFSDAVAPLLSNYQKKWREENAAAAIMTGETIEEPADEEQWLFELYDEIMSIDTEEEWGQFVTRFFSK